MGIQKWKGALPSFNNKDKNKVILKLLKNIIIIIENKKIIEAMD